MKLSKLAAGIALGSDRPPHERASIASRGDEAGATGLFSSYPFKFTRTLVRRMHREKWRFEIGHNSLDEFGIGHLVYFIHTPSGSLSFYCIFNAA